MHAANAVGIDNKLDEDFRHELDVVLRDRKHPPETFNDPTQWLKRHPRDLAVIMIQTRSAEDIRVLKSSNPESIIIAASTARPAPDTFRTYLRAGASGLIAAGCSRQALGSAFAAAFSGLIAVPEDIAEALANRLEEPPPDLDLTQRERKILHLAAQGATLNEIADATNYSHRHLRRITANILTTIGATNRAHAAALATRWGMD